MRLLQLESSGNFSLTEDYTEHVPLYAILSHTWGKDTEEVNFDDFKAGTYKGKTGYRKIQFCGEQAARDGLQYFWVDSCCINKSNHTELSEAINSMFSWYGNAAKCYVYLSDVSTRSDTDDSFSPSLWKLAFRDSRWFTRAWTLQELIAPHSVEFFSREGERLGDKRSLELSIHEITRIPLEVFRGKPLTQLSVQERMQWAVNRTAKRKEDEAYSLLGIFGLHMPLIYGEGRENAFVRLQEEISRRLRGKFRDVQTRPRFYERYDYGLLIYMILVQVLIYMATSTGLFLVLKMIYLLDVLSSSSGYRRPSAMIGLVLSKSKRGSLLQGWGDRERARSVYRSQIKCERSAFYASNTSVRDS